MGQRLDYMGLAPEGVAAMRGVEHYLNTESGLEQGLLEFVRLRASLLNGCEFCVGMHEHDLAKRNETADRIGQVAGWRESDVYTQRERAALAWTEVVTNVQVGHVPEEAFRAAREHFSEAELVNLTIAIGSINAWNRLGIAFQSEWRPKGRPLAVEDDGGKVSVEEEG
jgi:AhpD family alkylhydroperoxidase